MRIKVILNANHPLKHKKKIAYLHWGRGEGRSVYARFQYEKMIIFCFICGRLGHGDSFCPLRLTMDPKDVVFGWDLSLRSLTRRGSSVLSRWLREEVTGCGLIELRFDAEDNPLVMVDGKKKCPVKEMSTVPGATDSSGQPDAMKLVCWNVCGLKKL
ncbi:hypothetical protein GQ457_05G032910 [Hibiscus cannabinus]